MADHQGVNSGLPTTSFVVGGVYNVTEPTLTDGQACAVQLDINGNIKTSGGSSGSNVNISQVSGSAPALSNPLPVELSDGTNSLGVSGNPLHVTEKNVSQSPAAPTQVSVGASTTPVLGANASRTGLVVTNVSGNIISFGLGSAAVLNNGITLNPNGVWVMDSFTFTTGTINAIAGSGSSPLAVQEFS